MIDSGMKLSKITNKTIIIVSIRVIRKIRQLIAKTKLLTSNRKNVTVFFFFLKQLYFRKE